MELHDSGQPHGHTLLSGARSLIDLLRHYLVHVRTRVLYLHDCERCVVLWSAILDAREDFERVGVLHLHDCERCRVVWAALLDAVGPRDRSPHNYRLVEMPEKKLKKFRHVKFLTPKAVTPTMTTTGGCPRWSIQNVTEDGYDLVHSGKSPVDHAGCSLPTIAAGCSLPTIAA